MLYCPLCRAEFDDSVKTCGSCECQTIPELEPEAEAPMPEPPLALLVRADIPSAGIIAEELQEHGVASYIEPIHGLGFVGNAYSRVIISQKDGPKAAAVLEDLRRRHPKLGIDYTGRSETPTVPGL